MILLPICKTLIWWFISYFSQIFRHCFQLFFNTFSLIFSHSFNMKKIWFLSIYILNINLMSYWSFFTITPRITRNGCPVREWSFGHCGPEPVHVQTDCVNIKWLRRGWCIGDIPHQLKPGRLGGQLDITTAMNKSSSAVPPPEPICPHNAVFRSACSLESKIGMREV